MKKIINKKTYDTEKATFIGEWDNGESPTNRLDYIQKQLYMTADHEFFIHGQGGARTIYGKYVGMDSWGSGEKIVPVTERYARRLVREHLPEKYHEIFGNNPYYEIKDESGEAIEVGTWEQIADTWKATKADPCEKRRLALWEEQEDGSHRLKDEAVGEGYEEYTREELKDYFALDLHGSGWRADDREELQYQYNFTDWEVENLCEILKDIEKKRRLKTGRGSQPRHLEKEGEMDMKIDKEYVLDHRAMYDHLRADAYKYCSVFAGDSDIAALAYRTSKPGEIGEIPFGMDAAYYSWLIAGDTPVPEHYKGRLILDTDASWMWLYDDDRKTLDLVNRDGFQIYRAGEMGLLIRFK